MLRSTHYLLLVYALLTHTLVLEPCAHSALPTPNLLVVVRLLTQLPKRPATVCLTFTVMPAPIHALHVLTAVELPLNSQALPLSSLIVSAQITFMQPMESAPLVDAPLAASALPLQRDLHMYFSVLVLSTLTAAPRRAWRARLDLELDLMALTYQLM